MSYISTGAEYALHCLIHLARASALAVNEVSVRDLAALQDIPHDYLAKLFTKLARAGIVRATEGVKGGFRLARDAAGITVHDVVVAIDGDKPLFECQNIRGRCATFGGDVPAWAGSGVCAVHAVMQTTERYMRTALQKHTLAELAHRIDDVASPAYGVGVVEWLSHRASNRAKKTRRTPS